MNTKTLRTLFLQTTLTTIAVMALVIYFIGMLPDYATFESESSIGREQFKSINSESYLQRNLNFWEAVFFKDFGDSRVNREMTVGSILRRDGLISMSLFFLSILVSSFLGAVFGLLSSYFQKTWKADLIESVGLFFTSLPSFLLVPILIYLFSLKWELLPAALWEGPASLVLPVMAISSRPIFFLARVFSTQLSESSRAEYVATARAKGLRNFHIWVYHIIPNSLTSYLVGVGNLFGQLVAGSFLVETLFALPGLGFLFVKSLAERDYPVFLGLVFLFTVILQVGHRLSDLALANIGETKFNDQELVG